MIGRRNSETDIGFKADTEAGSSTSFGAEPDTIIDTEIDTNTDTETDTDPIEYLTIFFGII